MPHLPQHCFVLIIRQRVNDTILVEQPPIIGTPLRLPSLRLSPVNPQAPWYENCDDLLQLITIRYQLHVYLVGPLWESNNVQCGHETTTIVLYLELAEFDPDDMPANTAPYSPDLQLTDTAAASAATPTTAAHNVAHAPLVRFWMPLADAVADSLSWHKIASAVSPLEFFADLQRRPHWTQPWCSANFFPHVRAWTMNSLRLHPSLHCLRLSPVSHGPFTVTYRALHWPRGGASSTAVPAVVTLIVTWGASPELRVTPLIASFAQGFVPSVLSINESMYAFLSSHDENARPTQCPDRVRLARLLARLQKRSLANVTDLLHAGAPDFPLCDLASEFSSLTQCPAVQECASDPVKEALAHVGVRVVRGVVDALQRLNQPCVLVHGGTIIDQVVLAQCGHGDLYDEFRPEGRYQLVDWGNAFIGHPFCDLAELVLNHDHANGFSQEERRALLVEDSRAVQAYLDEWDLRGNPYLVREMLPLARVLAEIVQLHFATQVFTEAGDVSAEVASQNVELRAENVYRTLQRVAPFVGVPWEQTLDDLAHRSVGETMGEQTGNASDDTHYTDLNNGEDVHMHTAEQNNAEQNGLVSRANGYVAPQSDAAPRLNRRVSFANTFPDDGPANKGGGTS